MKHLQNILERVVIAIEVVAGIMLAVVTLIVVISAVSRYLFAYPLPDAFDISRFLLGAAIMWGFASVGYRGSHIKVDIIAELTSGRLRRLIDCFAWFVLLIFTALLAWKMFDRVLSAARSGEATMDMRIPAWPFLTLIWAGVAVAILATIARLLVIVTGRGTLGHYESTEATDLKDDQERR